MKLLYFGVFLLWLYQVLNTGNVRADTNNGTSTTNLTNDSAYCFEFTWFGPGYNNYTQYNGTCETWTDEKRIKDIPCRSPIVITYDGSPPDLDYLWTHHKQSVLCRRSKNEVCVKYSYIYNGEVNNATHMCTKVQTEAEEGAITSGCYTQKVNGYVVELCVCESELGTRNMPCNSGSAATLSFYVLVGLTLFKFINKL